MKQMPEEDRRHFNRCIRNFCEQAEFPVGEIQYLYTRRNVQIWIIKRPMSPLERMAFQEMAEPTLFISPIWKTVRHQIKNAVAAMFAKRYAVKIEQVILFDMQIDLERKEALHPVVVLCNEPIRYSVAKSQQEEPLSRTVARCLRDLLGKGPQQAKVYDLGKYMLFRFTGILTDEMRNHMNLSPDAENFFTQLYSFALKQAVNKSLESVRRNCERQFYLEDYHENEVNILLEVEDDAALTVPNTMLQIG
jgi:hypothetical protein